ncbi:unnamed protein product [Protopolystoma xenopodis]|uniref:Uncharacterized protein n=1 Tax=Protopolystoma xenopodis TaxID=117903 RepID=A0A3S5AM01_9PLAT|nr:unnamed protein product [Protopolystoma xenopodis]
MSGAPESQQELKVGLGAQKVGSTLSLVREGHSVGRNDANLDRIVTKLADPSSEPAVLSLIRHNLSDDLSRREEANHRH